MNFFEHQDNARQKTKFLVFYFVLALSSIILAVNAVVYGFLFYLAGDITASIQVIGYEPWQLVTPTVLILILFGTALKIFKLRGGGITVVYQSNVNNR